MTPLVSARIDMLCDRVKNARATVDLLVDSLRDAETGAHLAYSMEWSLDAFRDAARVKVFDRVIGALTKEDATATPESVLDYAQREVLCMAENPSRSSSPTHNLITQEIAAAWAVVADELGELLK